MQVLTVSLPLSIRKHGGRKRVMAPDGAPSWVPHRAQIDNTLVKAIARAHRWQRMLEDGPYSSIAELAAAERVNPSYLARVLRLTLLKPEIVEAILDGRHDAEHVSLDRLMKPLSVEWSRQLLRTGHAAATGQPVYV